MVSISGVECPLHLFFLFLHVYPFALHFTTFLLEMTFLPPSPLYIQWFVLFLFCHRCFRIPSLPQALSPSPSPSSLPLLGGGERRGRRGRGGESKLHPSLPPAVLDGVVGASPWPDYCFVADTFFLSLINKSTIVISLS